MTSENTPLTKAEIIRNKWIESVKKEQGTSEVWFSDDRVLGLFNHERQSMVRRCPNVEADEIVKIMNDVLDVRPGIGGWFGLPIELNQASLGVHLESNFREISNDVSKLSMKKQLIEKEKAQAPEVSAQAAPARATSSTKQKPKPTPKTPPELLFSKPQVIADARKALVPMQTPNASQRKGGQGKVIS